MKILFLIVFLLAFNCHAAETQAELTINQGHTQRVLTDKDFQQLHRAEIEIQDLVYHKRKRYAGYWLSEVFGLADVQLDPKAIWVFTALDGYQARVTVADVLRSGAKAFVTVKDLDAPDWEKIKQGKEWVSPAPYYLVWQSPAQVPKDIKLPWPYQMVGISVEYADETQQKLAGFKVFQQNCMSCHSLNLEGGTLGPELNVPRNILEYQDRKFLKEFIGNPSSFRANSKMPAFNDVLSSQELDDLFDYLEWMGKHKKD